VLRPVRLALALVVLLLASPAVAAAKEPPNPNDPCSSVGRNTCNTLGVGFYDTYRYGIRWFGDYRGAVRDVVHTFCIDLQYWYPSARYRFKESTADTLKNRAGETVSLESRRRMAYAMWAWGRSGKANQQAAVMLYVHGLMGDARPGEVDPNGVSGAVADVYDQVARDASRYHGPYRVVVTTPDRLRVGEPGTATIKVLSSSGVAVPDVELTLSADGAGIPSRTSTGADGVATVQFTPRSADGATIEAKTEPMASTLPLIYTPTVQAAAVNGQRLAAPASQTVTGSSKTAAFKAQALVASTADPAEITLGDTVRDRVTLRGVDDGFQGVVTARLFGPFRSTGAIRCDGPPAWEAQWQANGPGEYTTKPAKPPKPGWYVFRQSVPGTAGANGTESNCTDPAERVKVIAQPLVHTQVSDQQTKPGASITDRVMVEGLGGEKATIQAALYGPFASRDAITCDGKPAWTGTVAANGDGEYRTGPFKVSTPGYYTYRESLAASEFVRATETPCLDAAETTVVAAAPKVVTQVSDTRVRPGAQLTDRLTVTGAGPLTIAVDVELFGPFATKGGIACSGAPFWMGTVQATGDGTYTTEAVTVDRVGYYTYRESIAAAPQTSAFTGKCGVASETSLVTAVPRLSSVVSEDVIDPGGALADNVTVTGLGGSEAKIGVQLFGPFATQAAIRCTGTPYATAEVYAKGDGTVRTPAARVNDAGFYTYRLRLAGTDLIAETTTECPIVSETALARPLIITGRNERTGLRRWAAADPLTPTRVRVANLGIDAPVAPAGIDVKNGVLDVPAAISKLGWWLDGRTPGSPTGAVLIAGHVDSATAGAGALFRLKDAHSGDVIQVTAQNGRTFSYRVTSVKTVLKKDLPTDIYSRTGRARLVLVTCGGPFDTASGHYRDNVVVTAVPA
jgi:LPXTG-site transpeptidase (sortase) family protein